MNKVTITFFLICLVLSTGMTITFQFNTEQEPNEIKVMSYNIHQFFEADKDAPFEKEGDYIFESLLTVIKEVKPHIIGLQEAEGGRFSSGHTQGIAWLAEKLDMYYYYGSSVREQTYGNAILSEWPIIESKYYIYPTPEGIERELVEIQIDSPFGILNVFNTHFEIGRFEEAQRQAAEFLIDVVGTKPAIITGDFNSAFGDTTYNILAAEFTYGSIEAGLGFNDSSSYTSPTDNPRRKIDYIWLTKNDWQVTLGSYETVGNLDTSDHLGIVITLKPT